MTATIDPALQSSLRDLAPAGTFVAHRVISVGDEHGLLPEEASAFQRSVIQVQRASGAARIVARTLLERFGHPKAVLQKSLSGAPIWPRGIVGSIAHDPHVAIAVVGASENLHGLGVDIEPAKTLPADLLEIIATPWEREQIKYDPYQGQLLFVAKEAVYKALHPIDHIFLEHRDVEVDLARQLATARTGRVVNLRFCISTHLVVLAYLHRDNS